ncbi:MAG: hypothetical protein LBK63_06585, partial [Treponema sp.]|nr:hypothetical protein [Treponema sp.]
GADSGAGKIIPNEGIYWAPHRVIWSKETRSIFRVFILVRSPPQAGMRPNFKIHRFNAVWIIAWYTLFTRTPLLFIIPAIFWGLFLSVLKP